MVELFCLAPPCAQLLLPAGPAMGSISTAGLLQMAALLDCCKHALCPVIPSHLSAVQRLSKSAGTESELRHSRHGAHLVQSGERRRAQAAAQAAPHTCPACWQQCAWLSSIRNSRPSKTLWCRSLRNLLCLAMLPSTCSRCCVLGLLWGASCCGRRMHINRASPLLMCLSGPLPKLTPQAGANPRQPATCGCQAADCGCCPPALAAVAYCFLQGEA